MKFGSARHMELVERRIELLRSLLREEEEWRRAYLAMNLEAAERHSADEEAICYQIRAIDAELNASPSNLAKPSPVAAKASVGKPPRTAENAVSFEQKLRLFAQQMASLQLELQRSNQLKQAILRRSKRTISALRNLFDSHAAT